VLAPPFGQHVFFLRFQHWEPPDFFQIPGKAGFTRQNRQGCSLGHDSALHQLTPPQKTAGELVPPLPEPTAKVLYFALAT
jgi:hypothetical protein